MTNILKKTKLQKTNRKALELRIFHKKSNRGLSVKRPQMLKNGLVTRFLEIYLEGHFDLW